MKTKSKYFFFSLLIFFTLPSLWLTASAVQVNFSGTLINNPPCTIKGDPDPIEIDFKNIGITEINGSNYMEAFILKIKCDGPAGDQVDLYLGYGGMLAPFNNELLQTSKAGLGIQLVSRDGNEVIAPNLDQHEITIQYGIEKLLHFTAVPVMSDDPSVVLTEGPFTATATVEIRYP